MLTYKNIVNLASLRLATSTALLKAHSASCEPSTAIKMFLYVNIVNIIDSRTYSSYEVYDAQFTEKSRSFSEELLKGYQEVATRAGVTIIRRIRS
jgi:hypothetical protein